MNLIVNILMAILLHVFGSKNICLLVIDPGGLACLKLINAADLVD